LSSSRSLTASEARSMFFSRSWIASAPMRASNSSPYCSTELR
jgi:hypothetical protein